MTTTATFKSFISEPFELALGQPHQILISSASVAIVASEALAFIPFPFNIFLAVGAEWAYLRGLISGAGVKTPWAAALNTSAFLLVVLYGALWGFRGFHLIPAAPPPWAAVMLTLIHIGAIGAVTICSAMLHRASEEAKAEKQETAQKLEEIRVEEERAYQASLQRQRDAQQLELEAEWKRTQLQIDAERQRVALQIETEKAKADLKMQSADARRNAKPRSGTVPIATGRTATCKVCQKEVAWNTPSEAGTIKRWGCNECRSAQNTQR